jgi:hypothetical protein
MVFPDGKVGFRQMIGHFKTRKGLSKDNARVLLAELKGNGGREGGAGSMRICRNTGVDRPTLFTNHCFPTRSS